MARIWSTKDGRAIRGCTPPDKDWPYGSHQVVRGGMRAMYFRQASMNPLMARMGRAGRRARRSWARLKTTLVYSQVAQSMRAEGRVLKKEPLTFGMRLKQFAKELFS